MASSDKFISANYCLPCCILLNFFFFRMEMNFFLVIKNNTYTWLKT